eukprot:s4133_g4.t1
MTLFLIFMLTFFVQNPSRLPIYMMADVIQVARKLAQRLRSFRRQTKWPRPKQGHWTTTTTTRPGERRTLRACARSQDWRVVKFGHQEVQNATVGVLQHEQFLCQSVEGLAELAGKSRRLGYWCKARQKFGTVQLLITETRSR